MSQPDSEAENLYIQRFDTATIRDLDFPRESGDQALPYHMSEPVTHPEPALPAAAPEQAPVQQVPAAQAEGAASGEAPAPVTKADAHGDEASKPPLTSAQGEQPDKKGPRAPKDSNRLDPNCIPKYMNKLTKPPVFCPVQSGGDDETRLYVIDVTAFRQQILPEGYPQTAVWGYGGTVIDEETQQIRYVRSTPGPTFEAVRNAPIRVRWVNKLTDASLMPVDPTVHWANPNDMPMDPPEPWPPFPPGFPDAQSPVPIVTHLHGGEVPSIFDGYPDAWYTSDGKTGPACSSPVYTYFNSQEAATLWYHDHALGITRLNVYSGLAGFYLLRSGTEFNWQRENILPKGRYEIPLVIQDRSFNRDGSLAFTDEGVNPEIHPYWSPEFFGDAIMVNGKVWPNLDVERRQYRFRLLNGSNARFYNIRLSNGMTMTQIGSDGGFLPEPVELRSLLLAPAERADILIDFSRIRPGTKIILTNDAAAPYPDGDAPDPETTGQIMQFTVPRDAAKPTEPRQLPAKLNVIPALRPDAPQRILTLYEEPGPDGPVTLLLDRQNINADKYRARWELINGKPPLNRPTRIVPVEPYLQGSPIAPDKNETGWKDTVRMNPNQVTRIRVRFAPQNVPVRAARPGLNLYPFDPFIGPGYVWHCHILDHEDNEMMRPFKFKEG